ncbi:type II secretion system protein [Geomonas edaphica]|uniref:type II secretion system protein n=1 Tax=Geomonas edaphica TaxID=2570226 RepID=UPI0010A9366A|nr:type II secretion system protein [Geomonas edaphica]
MSKERGFTIVELVVVVAIMATLLTIGSLSFSTMQKKAKIEEQVRSIYSTLTDVRLQAMYTKSPRAVMVVGSSLNIYATNDTTVAPVSVVNLAFPMVIGPGAGAVVYDASGVVNSVERAICVEPGNVAENPGNMDSTIISTVRTYMGKRRSGGACAPSSIDQK